MTAPGNFAERRWTSPDGLSLFARDYAPGPGAAKPPVIAIHGLTRNSADFGVKVTIAILENGQQRKSRRKRWLITLTWKRTASANLSARRIERREIFPF